MTKFQERLKTCRLDKGYTQSELAKKAYLSKNTISNIERGITKKVSINELKLLSNALMVTEDYLLGFSDDSNKTRDGLIQPFYILPKWEWEYEIREILKMHSKSRVIEMLLRDFIYYLGQLDISTSDYYNNDSVVILQNFVKYLNSNIDKSDLKFLNSLLILLIEKKE